MYMMAGPTIFIIITDIIALMLVRQEALLDSL